MYSSYTTIWTGFNIQADESKNEYYYKTIFHFQSCGKQVRRRVYVTINCKSWSTLHPAHICRAGYRQACWIRVSGQTPGTFHFTFMKWPGSLVYSQMLRREWKKLHPPSWHTNKLISNRNYTRCIYLSIIDVSVIWRFRFVFRHKDAI